MNEVVLGASLECDKVTDKFMVCTVDGIEVIFGNTFKMLIM